MSGALLEVAGLTAGYGPVQVLNGLDFTVADGEIVVILGANGAGKTTTMRAISAMIPRSGTITFDGVSIGNAKPDAVLRSGISQVPQGRGTFSDLSVEDNLLAGGYTSSSRCFPGWRNDTTNEPGPCPEANNRCLRSHAR